MATKLLVTLRRPDEARTVRESGMEVLAEYPDSMLVRGTDEQARRLVEQGIEADTLPERLSGSRAHRSRSRTRSGPRNR